MYNLVKRNPVLVFVVLTLVYQFIVVGIVTWMLESHERIHHNDVAHMIFRFRVFGPLVFAVLLTWYIEGKKGLGILFHSFLKWKVHPGWYVFAFSWKFLFTYVGIAFLVLVGVTEWPGWVVDNFFGGDYSQMNGWLMNLPFILGIAFVEETAWMKYCVTKLQERYTALTACILTGVAWGAWYLPMLLLGEGTPDGYPWHIFLLSMVALAIILGWTFNMTQSGMVLLIMQIISNCAFFVIPVLPGWWNMDPIYINAFVVVEVIVAIAIVIKYGGKELGVNPRARWSDSH
jgi:membrane protease YdiL (CAAX protease family)